MRDFHTPVLLDEVLEYLNVRPGGKYIDATLGGGGHTEAILEKGGTVLAIDVDEDALQFVKQKIQIGNEVTLVRGNFREMDTIAKQYGFEKVNGIVFDLGVSSYQLEQGERGFSFQHQGPLDMRMDRNLQVRAADLLNGLTKKELYELFTTLSEEHNAWAISEAIVRSRRIKRIETTADLVGIVESAVLGNRQRSGTSNINKSTRVFQALRIAVNDELHALEEALPKAFELLEENGRLVVIAFHSLEDRIVKNEFKRFEEERSGLHAGKAERILTKKPIAPSQLEILHNRRARSAKLRAIEKA